jgi:biotin carboxyl carrier protein
MNKFVVTIEGRKHQIELPTELTGQLHSPVTTFREYPSKYTILVDGVPVEIIIPDLDNPIEAVQCLIVNDRPVETTIDPNMRWIKSTWGLHSLEIRDLDTIPAYPHNGNGNNGNHITVSSQSVNGRVDNGRLTAPIPGLIIQVRIVTGEPVEAGQSLFILEAMKMENDIRAPRSGIIKSINVSPGQVVALNQVLAEIE